MNNNDVDEAAPIPENPFANLTVAESSPLEESRAAQSAPQGSKQRVRWQSLSSVTTVNSAGEPTTVYPFLQFRQNWTYIMLVRQLMVDQPFAASFGQSGLAWKTCAQALSTVRDPEGLLVYGTAGVSDKSIKKRFEDLMTFVKKQENLVPFRSGTDNEPSGEGELVSALEGLYEIYCDVVSDREAASASAAQKKADDTANADVLRSAALGMLTEKEKYNIRQRKKSRIDAASSSNDAAESITTTSTSSTPSEVSSGKRFRPPSDVQHFVNRSSERMERHSLLAQSKEERKKEQQQIKAKQWDLEFEFKKQQAERANELQRMQLELQTEMIRFLQGGQQQPDCHDAGTNNNK